MDRDYKNTSGETDGSRTDPLRQWAEQKVKERNELQQHLVMFVLVNGMLWAIWALTGAGFPWPIFATGGWGIGIGAHVLDYRQKFGRGYNQRNNAVEAEVERELAREQARQRRRNASIDREAQRQQRHSDDSPIQFE